MLIVWTEQYSFKIWNTILSWNLQPLSVWASHLVILASKELLLLPSCSSVSCWGRLLLLVAQSELAYNFKYPWCWLLHNCSLLHSSTSQTTLNQSIPGVDPFPHAFLIFTRCPTGQLDKQTPARHFVTRIKVSQKNTISISMSPIARILCTQTDPRLLPWLYRLNFSSGVSRTSSPSVKSPNSPVFESSLHTAGQRSQPTQIIWVCPDIWVF